jgi:hypothetical protein
VVITSGIRHQIHVLAPIEVGTMASDRRRQGVSLAHQAPRTSRRTRRTGPQEPSHDGQLRAIHPIARRPDEFALAVVHHTIVTVDIAGFGDRSRTNMNQVRARRGMYAAMEDAFAAAGVRWDLCRHEDRGDGILILAPAHISKTLFVDYLPDALAEALTRHNRTHPVEERIRLRLALHAGEINYDEHGVTAASINLAFRLIDADALKMAFTKPSVLAIVSSNWFYDEVIRHSESSLAKSYRPIEIANKETRARAWVRLLRPTPVRAVG